MKVTPLVTPLLALIEHFVRYQHSSLKLKYQRTPMTRFIYHRIIIASVLYNIRIAHNTFYRAWRSNMNPSKQNVRITHDLFVI